ncbi:GAF and ANTAR domain-containing protein [Herbiconiux sp. CPCC 205716]|uniref:GAF and ANTAR domain-containing protein n=1 Tax=Herbiconiux gentiana TaxID=2970912 RepID=A0ABT2GG10_9MICO|nr:GAF and ANTAR domain-containing protein [Herbiconiux gentiana]MCS5715164.1 GAF and ANTAR domain-containing protein [Herbiconiux gentiana]
MADAYTDALRELREFSGDDPSRLAEPIARSFPVSGASICTLGEILSAETVSASDPVAARLDELQLDLGEGPCWDALRSISPVFEPDIQHSPRGAWPMFLPAVAHEAIGAVFAFPLVVGHLRLGAVDLYCIEPMTLSPLQIRQASTLAAVVSRLVLRRALEAARDDEPMHPPVDRFSRRAIHQATGMVIAQLGVSVDDAEMLLRGHAYAENRSMAEVAADILDGRLRFSIEAEGIEDVQ